MQIHLSNISRNESERVLLNKDEVIRIWEERLRREVPQARGLPEPLLRNSLPQWLDHLSQALENPESRYKLERLSITSRAHGAERADIHFDLNELIYEYTVLRQVLLEVLETPSQLPVRQRDILLNVIDVSVRNAVFEHTRRQRQHLHSEAWRLENSTLWQRYVRTVALVAVFAVLQWALWPLLEPLAYIMFYPAVTLAALYGSAPLAVLLSVLLAETVFVPPPFFMALPDINESVRVAIFSGSSFLVAYITNALRESRRMALAAFAEQERARVQAERNVATLDALLATAPFGLCVLDSEMRYIRINEPLARWNGVAVKDHIGRTLAEVLGEKSVFPERIIRHVMETGEAVSNVEHELVPASDPGRVHIFETSFYPVRTASGVTVGIGAMVVDVSEQKAVEKALREQQWRFDLALRAGDIGVWELNLKSREIKWSARQYAMFHLEPGSPLDWEKFCSMIHPDDLSKITGLIERPGLPDTETSFEYRVRLADGQTRWIQSNGRLLDEVNGGNVMLGTDIDITERKKAEVLREQFVSTLSHDLRTPLTAARMAAQLVSRHVNNRDKVLANGAKVIDCLDRADKMIRDLLDANRIRVGQRLPIQPTAVEMISVVRNTVDELASIHGDRFRVEEHSPVNGQWDMDGLRRLIENLCTNAVKYGEPGTPITVSVHEAGPSVDISVHNYGAPIPPQNRDKLFDYLHRASEAQVSGKVGWGIGLTLVRGVTEAHGGKVSVRSEAGAGTTFTVTLPKTVNNDLSI
ncbi:MAG: PAS domain-containing protein [Bdellovibrionales bacterium]|nr:PAS domain-containing protein [Bdellovibrionales bacterium]